MENMDFGCANHDITSSTRKNLSRIAHKLMNIRIPTTLTGITSFGFKVGIFLVLKSYLILRNIGLSATGYVMVGSQFILAVILIAMGVTIQNEHLMEKYDGLKRVSAWYLIGSIIGYTTLALGEKFAWKFFSSQESGNWFMDSINFVRLGIGEISMNILFVDQDLWSFFCLLLSIVIFIYRYTILGGVKSLRSSK